MLCFLISNNKINSLIYLLLSYEKLCYEKKKIGKKIHVANLENLVLSKGKESKRYVLDHWAYTHLKKK